MPNRGRWSIAGAGSTTGTRTIVVTPNADVLEAAEGFPRQRPEAANEIVEAARQQTVDAFADRRRRSI